MRLCRGKGVVAVADRIHDRGCSAERAFVLCDRCRNEFKYLAADEITRNMPAAEHEIEIVKLFHLILARRKRRNDPSLIIGENHNMRKLERRSSADAAARRNAFKHGRLGRTDGRNRRRGVIVFLKIELADKSAAHTCAFKSTLHIDHDVFILFQKSPHGIH